MNKEILFEDIRCGNLSAFEALFRQYYPSMCVIAGKLVANREVAEDIVQDVFLSFWKMDRGCFYPFMGKKVGI